MWSTSKNLIVHGKIFKLICYQTKTQIKLLTKSNCDQTQRPKFWQNSKTQIVTKLKTKNGTQPKSVNFDKT